jgi:predicted ATP-binding protein involved in virulence
LEEVKRLTSSEAKYNFTSKKFRYEIELPSKVEVNEDEFILTSAVKTNKRYQTDTLRELVSTLEEKEEVLNNSLAPFIRGIFGRFYKYRSIF